MTTAAASLSTPPTAGSSVPDKPPPRPKHHKKKVSMGPVVPRPRRRCVCKKLTFVGFACKQPAGTASCDLQDASNGAGNSGIKAQRYMEPIVVPKITEITSSQEDE